MTSTLPFVGRRRTRQPALVSLAAMTVAVAAASLSMPPGRAAAQAPGGGPMPSGTSAAAGLDFVKAVFGVDGGSFDFDVDPQELPRVDPKKWDTAHFSGKYTTQPCPDAHGTAHVNVDLDITVRSEVSGTVQSSQVKLPIDIDVNDSAQIENVSFRGRYFDEKPNTRHTLEESRTRVEYNRAIESTDAVVDNEGPYDKAVLQNRADKVAEHAAALAEKAAKQLEGVWQDGHTCVTLKVTPPSKSVKPKEKLSIEVVATSAQGGGEINRPVSAELKGDTSIKPSKSGHAPATFKYVSPKKKGGKGRIRFEQRSKRGIGRAEVEYEVGGKWRFDLTATKVIVGCNFQPPCGISAELSGLSATVEPAAENQATGNGVASVHVATMKSVIRGRCSSNSSITVPMTVSVEADGQSFRVTASAPNPATFQACHLETAPESTSASVDFGPVSVPATDGATKAATSRDSTCLVAIADADSPNVCTFTVTAHKVD